LKLKEIFYKLIPNGLGNSILKRQVLKTNHVFISFAQEGEDKILEKYFGEQTNKGFFIDVGANHPYKFSNTFKFYLKGWRGINIDANPGTKKLFDQLRPRDINIETGVSKKPSQLDFYVFETSLFNTFDKEVAFNHSREFSIKIKKVIQLETRTLAGILDGLDLPLDKIDFMSVDVEGLDLEVLESNNWDKYRPEVILIESLYTDLENIRKNPIVQYLGALQYKLFAKTYNTLFFSNK
jgi:FkbM family methyltransferase